MPCTLVEHNQSLFCNNVQPVVQALNICAANILNFFFCDKWFLKKF
jgi:hypothetical protein